MGAEKPGSISLAFLVWFPEEAKFSRINKSQQLLSSLFECEEFSLTVSPIPHRIALNVQFQELSIQILKMKHSAHIQYHNEWEGKYDISGEGKVP